MGDDLGGPLPVILDPHGRLSRPLHLRLIPVQPAKTGAGAGDGGSDGLVDLVGDRGGQRTQCSDTRHMGELGTGPRQGLLGGFAFSYVLNRADEHGATRYRLHYVGNSMDMLHVPSRGDDAVGEFEFPSSPSTVRLNAASNNGRSSGWTTSESPMRDSGRRIELEDPEELLGPVVVVHQQIRDEAASLAQPLGFRETKVGLLDLRLRPLSLLDVERGRIPSIDSSLLIEQRIVADLEPAIYAVLTEDTLLIFER